MQSRIEARRLKSGIIQLFIFCWHPSWRYIASVMAGIRSAASINEEAESWRNGLWRRLATETAFLA